MFERFYLFFSDNPSLNQETWFGGSNLQESQKYDVNCDVKNKGTKYSLLN